MKIRVGCQYVGYFHYSEHLNWAACGPRVGHSCARNWFNQKGFSFFLVYDYIKEKSVPYQHKEP